MRIKFCLRSLSASLLVCATSAFADVSGTTFLDYNGNGVMDITGATGSAVDAGIGGVSVRAFGVTALGADATYGTKDDVVGACGPAVLSSTVAGTLGQYTIPMGSCLAGSVRVEFSGWPSPLQPGLSGQTTVQFVSTTATGVSLPLINATRFCENNPQLVTSCYVFGNQVTGANNASDVLVSFPYSAGGTTQAAAQVPAPAHIAVASQVGSTYGLAFQQSTQRLFAAAYTKFATGYGPSGPGAIYAVDRSNGDAVTTFVDINAAGMIDAARPGLFGPGAAGVDQFASGSSAAIQGSVSMSAWGDIDLSEDGNTIYALNENNLRVYAIPAVAGPLTSSTSINVLPPIPFPASGAGCSTTRMISAGYQNLLGPHAMGLGVNNGALYVGGRCQSGGETGDFYVFRYDLANNAWDALPVLTFPLAVLTHAGFSTARYASNIADIGFASNGDMVFALRNISADKNNSGASVGQLLRACQTGATFTLESNGQCGSLTGFSPGNNNGPGGGQYFQTDIAADGQPHSQQGGIAIFPERDTVVTTSYDQFRLYETNASWWTISSGANTKDYQVLATPAPTSTSLDNKAGALGELEAVCKAAPVEIGNRIWRDLNENGVQDPSEPAIAGVTVELRTAGGDLLGTAVTDANGQYIFSNDARGYPVTGNTGTATGGYIEDSQGGTASTTAFRYGIPFKSGDVLSVVIPNAEGGAQQASLAGLVLTPAVLGGNTAIDSNFALSASAATASVIAGAPGVNNHTIDAGFAVPVIDLTVAKSVTSAGPYSVGSTVTFALNASNNGPSTAQEQIVVQDCLPDGLAFASATGTGWTCSNVAGPTVIGALTCSSVVTCTRDAGSGTLAASAFAAPITINTTVAVGTSGALVNVTKVAPAANETVAESNVLGSANGGFETGDPAVGSNNDASASVSVATTFSIGDLIFIDQNNNGVVDGSEAPLSGVKVELFAASGTGAPTGAALGTVTTDATGRYRFDALSAGNYVVVATPPTGYVSSTGTAATSGNVSTNELDNGIDSKIASGSGVGGFPSAVIVLGPANTEAAAESNNTSTVPSAQISGAGGEAPDNRSDRTVDFGFYQPFDLRITKSVTSVGPYIEGSTVTYTLSAENLGPGVAGGAIVVKDKLPAGLIGVSAVGTNWTCVNAVGAGVEITCTRAALAGALAAAAQAELIAVTATVAVGATGSLVNKAQVNPDPADAAKTELIPLGTTDTGYDDGTNTSGSNNDDSKPIAIAGLTYSIGDLVWNDSNNNGKLDGTEAPLSGVTVQLFAATAGNPTGAAIGSVTTDATGRYRFDALPAGDYVVVATPATGFLSSTGEAISGGAVGTDELDNGGDVKLASGPGAGGFRSPVITLGPSSGEPTAERNNTSTVPSAQVSGAGGEAPDNRSDRTVDFGFYQPFDLRVTKSITSAGPYTSGVSTVTYTILAENLGPGVASAGIVVKDKLPAGLIATAASGTDWTCTPTTGAAVEIVCTRAASASALAASASAALITVTATIDTAATGSLVNSAQVNPSPADASRPELIPLGASNGGYEDGANGTGSNNDDSKSIAVGSATYSLGNRVWNDLNNDGTFNLGEVGLGNVAVRLLSSTGAVIASTTTDGMGFYQFTGLAAGTYSVEIVPPAGYLSSTGANGSAGGPYETAGNANNTSFTATSGATDHGVTQASGTVRSGAITLGEGQPSGEGVDHPATLVDATADDRSNRNVDFGLFIPASVGTTVWVDNGSGGGVANDGVRQTGEAGIGGVTVRLLTAAGAPVLDGAGQPITTVTDANGNYRIGNLNPGSYRVEFQFPAQSVWTPTVNPAGSGAPPTNPASGGTDAQRNEMSSGTRQTPVITLGPGQDNPNLDSGVRTFSATAVQQEIPTLSFWMLLLLSGILGGVAVRSSKASRVFESRNR